MAVMPLVPETNMADIGKQISLGNLLVRKVTWLVLTTTSTVLILSRAFEAHCMTRVVYIYSRLPSNHSLTQQLTETTPSLSYILTSSCQPYENVYILQPFSFLFCLFG